MTASRNLLTFLHKLAARHISATGLVASTLETLSKGGEAGISRAYIPDDKMRFTAHLLSVVGQDTAEERASMIAKACTIAVETAKDKDEELSTLLVEAIEAMAEDVVLPVAACNVDALRAEFAGSEVEIVSRGGRDFYTFKNRAAYPAELTMGDKKLQLCNASYRKGTYQLVK